MRYFTTDGQRRAIAEEAGCGEEAFELKPVWSEMSILVQARDPATTESVVRPRSMSAVFACVQITMNYMPASRTRSVWCLSACIFYSARLTLFSSAVIPVCLSILTPVTSKGH